MVASCYLLFVFVSPAERCSLENFSNPWRAVAVDVQTFQKKENRRKFLVM
jgi:hypothetical protein